MAARIQKVVTSGAFKLDGGSWDVDNNVWLVGDDAEVLVIDAAHDAAAILDAVAGRTVTAVELGEAAGAQVWFPPADRMLWDAEHDAAPDQELHTGATFEVAGSVLRAVSTPGHSPGSTCLYAEDLGALFSGDTLFAGGPGATGRSYSDFDTMTPSFTPATGTTPRSVRRRPTSTSGSPGVTDCSGSPSARDPWPIECRR